MVGMRAAARARPRAAAAGAAIALAAMLLSACGDTTKLPEAATTGALTATPVAIQQTGDAPAQVDTSSVTFQLDDSGTLVMHFTVRSNAGSSVTVTARASLYNSAGSLIGDASGGVVNLASAGTTQVELNGPSPNGTIARATIELATQESPTPTSASS